MRACYNKKDTMHMIDKNNINRPYMLVIPHTDMECKIEQSSSLQIREVDHPVHILYEDPSVRNERYEDTMTRYDRNMKYIRMKWIRSIRYSNSVRVSRCTSNNNNRPKDGSFNIRKLNKFNISPIKSKN